MVRVFIKGGVWKNSEDEILKAAVQKYGKQQWARVASLLNRKSAKQCKARWHEWLDPSVRKVEWSRAEEEKLLHLAKLMPAQWKTIAPLVGRTASQCQEHYESLLDQAAGASAADGEEGGVASLRNFQPGQIDSHPETKPARPDPIDMDEDEIEMLQEARARLANTQGKKAKRKAREKMLAQAKRLADLQKRRELKQAGLLSSAARKKVKRKSRDIDLGVEIPFHKPAPVGFHDTSAEAARGEAIRQKRLKSVDYKQVNENQYRTRDREAAQAKKREQARLRALEKSNMQYVVAQVSKENDPLETRKRGKLELPAPAVSDQELGQLAKLQANQQAGTGGGSLDPNSATRALLGDYSDRPLPTPMRTPAANSGMTTQESIMREASKLRKLGQVQTPLLGTSVPKDEDVEEEEDDYEDKVALSSATPRLGGPGSTGTPAPDRAGVGQTPSVAPPRDELGLNRRYGADDASVGASTFATSAMSIREMAREERRAAKRARLELEQALAALPAPQFEYELAMPQDAGEMDEDGPKVETIEEDAADLEAAEMERLKKKAEKLYEARSSVVKRKDLPRPRVVVDASFVEATEEAERLVQQEMVTLLKHDAHAFPVISTAEAGADGKKKKKKKGKKSEEASDLPPEVPLDYIPEEYLDSAKNAVQAELQKLMEEATTTAIRDEKAKSEADALDFLVQQTIEASGKADTDHVFGKAGWSSAEQALESLKLEFETLKEAAAALREKNEKAEAKLVVVHGGYAKRAEKVRIETVQAFQELQNAQIEEAVYRKLQAQEVAGAASRLEKLREEISNLEADEAAMQKKYSDLLVEKRRLSVKRKASD